MSYMSYHICHIWYTNENYYLYLLALKIQFLLRKNNTIILFMHIITFYVNQFKLILCTYL